MNPCGEAHTAQIAGGILAAWRARPGRLKLARKQPLEQLMGDATLLGSFSSSTLPTTALLSFQVDPDYTTFPSGSFPIERQVLAILPTIRAAEDHIDSDSETDDAATPTLPVLRTPAVTWFADRGIQVPSGQYYRGMVRWFNGRKDGWQPRMLVLQGDLLVCRNSSDHDPADASTPSTANPVQTKAPTSGAPFTPVTAFLKMSRLSTPKAPGPGPVPSLSTAGPRTTPWTTATAGSDMEGRGSYIAADSPTPDWVVHLTMIKRLVYHPRHPSRPTARFPTHLDDGGKPFGRRDALPYGITIETTDNRSLCLAVAEADTQLRWVAAIVHRWDEYFRRRPCFPTLTTGVKHSTSGRSCIDSSDDDEEEEEEEKESEEEEDDIADEVGLAAPQAGGGMLAGLPAVEMAESDQDFAPVASAEARPLTFAAMWRLMAVDALLAEDSVRIANACPLKRQPRVGDLVAQPPASSVATANDTDSPGASLTNKEDRPHTLQLSSHCEPDDATQIYTSLGLSSPNFSLSLESYPKGLFTLGGRRVAKHVRLVHRPPAPDEHTVARVEMIEEGTDGTLYPTPFTTTTTATSVAPSEDPTHLAPTVLPTVRSQAPSRHPATGTVPVEHPSPPTLHIPTRFLRVKRNFSLPGNLSPFVPPYIYGWSPDAAPGLPTPVSPPESGLRVLPNVTTAADHYRTGIPSPQSSETSATDGDVPLAHYRINYHGSHGLPALPADTNRLVEWQHDAVLQTQHLADYNGPALTVPSNRIERNVRPNYRELVPDFKQVYKRPTDTVLTVDPAAHRMHLPPPHTTPTLLQVKVAASPFTAAGQSAGDPGSSLPLLVNQSAMPTNLAARHREELARSMAPRLCGLVAHLPGTPHNGNPGYAPLPPDPMTLAATQSVLKRRGPVAKKPLAVKTGGYGAPPSHQSQQHYHYYRQASSPGQVSTTRHYSHHHRQPSSPRALASPWTNAGGSKLSSPRGFDPDGREGPGPCTPPLPMDNRHRHYGSVVAHGSRFHNTQSDARESL
ncbi:hypothetical protein IWQ60_010886, partial [Tieghemiomyces parasiticus]